MVSAETETQPQEPANCGLLGHLREICRFERLRGGLGRTRTSNQTVMNWRQTIGLASSDRVPSQDDPSDWAGLRRGLDFEKTKKLFFLK